MSAEAVRIFSLMSKGMRLIVPVGDHGMRLVADKRFGLDLPDEDLPHSKLAVLELIRCRAISALPEHTAQWKAGEGGKVGWREMELGHIPQGAEVYACAQ